MSVLSDTKPLFLTTMSVGWENVKRFAPRPSIENRRSPSIRVKRALQASLESAFLIASGKSLNHAEDPTATMQFPFLVRAPPFVSSKVVGCVDNTAGWPRA